MAKHAVIAKDTVVDRLAKAHGKSIPTRLGTENAQSKLFGKKEPKQFFEHITSHDPSPNGSYKTWLGNTYMNRGIRYSEDLPRAKNALTLFHKHKDKLPNKDIQSYKSLPQLESAVKPFEGKSESTGSEWSQKGKQFIANKQATELHNDKDYHIVTPHTVEASKHFGTNTKWCTTAKKDDENMFNHYNESGKLHYVLHKPTNTRYAFHVPNNHEDVQGFDEKDDELDAPKFAKDHPRAANIVASKIHPIFNPFSKPSNEDIDNAITSPDKSVRRRVAKVGNKDQTAKLVHDPEWTVKAEIAKRGHHIDKLVKDKDYAVRLAVARHGHKEHLDKLVDDSSFRVRKAVAKNGHKDHLDKLVDDPSSIVRWAVVKHKHKEHLDKLLNDKDSDIRYAVANRGDKEHLDKLVNDKDKDVRQMALRRQKDPSYHDKLS